MDFKWYELLIPIVTGILGYLLRLFFDKRKELYSEATKERRKLYLTFLELTMDLFQLTANQAKLEQSEFQTKFATINEKMFAFYTTYMLYATPDVITALSNFKQFQYQYIGREHETDLKAQYEMLGAVIKEMREDLGLSNKDLGKSGEKVFRTMLTNYNTIMTMNATDLK
ncbi:hypothetical protein G5B37_11295 [Rasiella rasia]|uniref:Uncharacterized protein n=1 Tax=Rasiella rasia TaxID=2744027 RepID=A0A6G6GNL6_9FLAO|nr:hypothetical protein [Rasiella rasia]QIE60124.1 hypothetical protein G5B37_11295 [Rasiella rasia]